jgi:hypothetical protein
MREVNCAACEAKVPMGEAFTVADRSLCKTCLEKFLSEPGADQKLDGIARMLDPTVCIHCSSDQGREDWPTVAGLPTCAKCEDFFRNRPYPGWLKVSFAVFLCVAIGAFVYNLRYFRAYVEMLQAQRAMEAGDIPKAAHLYEAASVRLPEIPELAVIPSIYNAQRLIAEDKNQEALDLLDKSRPHAPPDMHDVYRQIELAAQIGLAFDRKDYDAFLAYSKEAAALAPNESMIVGSIASAYACKYAATGDPKFKELSLQELARAKDLARANGDDFEEYENRTLFRLETREIIKRDEFKKRFPNGWKPKEGK